jgi:hypothetical protein
MHTTVILFEIFHLTILAFLSNLYLILLQRPMDLDLSMQADTFTLKTVHSSATCLEESSQVVATFPINLATRNEHSLIFEAFYLVCETQPTVLALAVLVPASH